MRLPNPFPYQGSKRNIADQILSFFPEDISRLIEPFAGSAAVSIAAGYSGKAKSFIINDINKPLINLWSSIIDEPEKISSGYEALWNRQLGMEREFYNQIRTLHNKDPRPEYFLYLLARCVKGSIRYNANGGFNQSPDNRRKGMRPERMRKNIVQISRLFRGRAELFNEDYKYVLDNLKAADLVYMDPPYQGVGGTRDPRYLMGLSRGEFIDALASLNEKGISYILSYDGRTGDKFYGESLPEKLNLSRVEMSAGRSCQATLLGRKENTFESLYLSPALQERMDFPDKDEEIVMPCRNLLFQGN
jgi:DNA adenine methylase